MPADATVIPLPLRPTGVGEGWTTQALRMLNADERVLVCADRLVDVADDADDATSAYLNLRAAVMERRASYQAAGAEVTT